MITQKELKELINYDASTGVITWLVASSNRIKAGDVAGGKLDNSYRRITLLSNHYLQHRIAWIYTYGYEPNVIDHINHNGSDNRIKNLRDTDHPTNCKNMRKSKANKSGITGVQWIKRHKKWTSEIMSCGKRVFIGNYLSLFEACCARKSAEIKYNFHVNHGK